MIDMNDKKNRKTRDAVAILMSTYNGGDFIEDQLRTIYSQTYPKINLFIRDDGSEPAFRKKLEKLRDQYGFTLFLGENRGFLKSFFTLARYVHEQDGRFGYYSFADQDDLWFPNKVEESVRRLKKKERQLSRRLPMVCHSAYLVANEAEVARLQAGDLQAENIAPHDKRYFYFPEKGYSFRRSITENHYSGFSMTINDRMMEIMLEADPDQIDYHDWFISNIAHAFGWACSDSRPMAVHRLHRTNVTLKTLPRQCRWFLESLRKESDIRRRMKEFSRCCSGSLSPEKRKILWLFAQDTLRHRLVKAFYPRRWRPDLASELAMRLLMLLGRI